MSAARATELSYAVHPRIVLKYLGQLCLVLAALTAIPLGVALLAGDGSLAWHCAFVLAVLLAAGGGFARLPSAARIQVNEALAIVGLAFVIAPVAMAYPLMASGLSFVDALFEATSGITTTGLTMLPHVQGQSRALLFMRAWMEWYGGLGFVVLSLALLMRPGITARQLAGRSVDEETLVGNTKAYARIMLIVYCILTAFAFLLLAIAGVDPFTALSHAFSAISTGGFSTRDDGLAGFASWPIQAIVTFVCLLGALPMSLYFRAARRSWRDAAGDAQLRGLAIAALTSVAVLILLLRGVDGMPWSRALHNGSLLAFSAQTTAGFTSTDITALSAAAKWALMLSMFIGGGVGSTAGGIKILRFATLLLFLEVTVRRTALPEHAVIEPRLGGRRLDDAEVHHTFLLILLFCAVIILSWLPFLIGGHDPLDSLFEIISATSTTGLSSGVTAPSLATPLKLVLCADMLLGRLEMVALFVIVYPRTWVGKRTESP